MPDAASCRCSARGRARRLFAARAGADTTRVALRSENRVAQSVTDVLVFHAGRRVGLNRESPVDETIEEIEMTDGLVPSPVGPMPNVLDARQPAVAVVNKHRHRPAMNCAAPPADCDHD